MNTKNHDPFAEYDAALEAKGKAEIAAEDAAWKSKPQTERDRICKAREERLDAFFSSKESDEEE